MRSTCHLIFAAPALLLGGAMAATTCESLAKLSLPETTITMAASVTPGAFKPPASFSLNLQPWNGCSTGGRQGLEDVQRYPGDFDGVIAGAPANNPRSSALRMWIAPAVHKGEASYIPPTWN